MNHEQKGPFRADHVGSLLRPDSIKQARSKYARGTLAKEELREIENEAIENLIEKQKEIGLTAITDGELRREYWHLDFIRELRGIRVYHEESEGMFQGKMKTLAKYMVDGPLQFPENHPFLEDFAFVKKAAGENHVAKFTIPGPNMIFYSGIINNAYYLENPAYSSLEEAAKDIVQVYKDAIQAFYDKGCRYLQLDDTSWGALFSDDFRKIISENGFDVNAVMKQFADITIAALEDKPENMTVTLHVCRGNFKSSWLYEGDYEPIASQLFGRVNVDGFFLEFDSDRAGNFAPLRYIRNQRVVLGLVTTKTAEMEDKKAIKDRIKEAERYVSKEQLCLSPQCGFASTEEGNLVTEEDQWKKLRLVVDTAGEVWSDNQA
ncbi:5-methyltetrahydropteroyltriglutamate--homocysteine methyltransferase [Lentibacillus kapialis]|uniref:5-methyltetrahydropteroyltriglutamate--homocysteine methyltransferase n=1 Tax=Lentibacillus kapialis TaxID=340214 RepID=A0A917PYW9_9BACI|nr:5-methyltetrahydropteroyltriglutamate--homocysteine S-methyltransferase [Lentibacillus kapialis]GGJ99783.1 5-methyltetrahydropteroyltriglutamate--homocysteine methyltransferase [Lentibacillus kapialis]